MIIDITIPDNTIKQSEALLKRQLPSSIKELWLYFQELSDCLWKIRDEINKFIDAYPTHNCLPGNYRYDSRFSDSKVRLIEENIENRMKECSEEAKRIEKEREKIALNMLRGIL